MKKAGVLAVGAFALLLLGVYWFSDPMPDPFGRISTEEGGVFNYYIVGY